jgi:serine/threonine protein kinase/formylglycine-generating enzyme required for sulfatase activity
VTTTAGSIKRLKDDLAPGARLGRYRLEDPVGRGGMGTVYACFDETTNRKVALKLLAEGIPLTLRERFLAECEAEANIRHEHVMPVYDRGWYTEERPYFVMELLYEPITLTEIVELIQQGKLGSQHPRLRHWNDLRRLIADVVLPVCEGVHVANEEYGIQHRDLKPDNVLVDIRTRRPYLIDFGICRRIGDRLDVGKIVGTPRYLSPEQAKATVDPRTDVWGVGALLRYVVTGEPPIRGTSPFKREAKALDAGEKAKARGYAGRRAQLEDPDLRLQDHLFEDARAGNYEPLPYAMSAGLAAIINKAMAPASTDRYENAGALMRDLATWVKGGSVSALAEKGAGGAAVDWARRLLNRNVVRAVGTLVALAVGFLLGTGLFSKTPPPPDHRAEDAAAELARLEAAARTLVDGAASPRTGLGAHGEAYRHARIARRVETLEARMAAAESAPPGDLEGQLGDLRARLQPGEVVLDGWAGGPWALGDLIEPGGHAKSSGRSKAAPPGPHLLESQDQALRLRLVLSASPTGRRRVLRFAPVDGDVPSGMRWVPAFGRERPFLADARPVTNEKYAEWLDDMPAAERGARVPKSGFRRDPRDPTRWLVDGGAGNAPVRGVSAADAAAYAAWRSAAEGVELALPTEAQWQRIAGIDWMGEAASDAVVPWRAARPWRMRHRRGEHLQPSATVREMNHESPAGFAGVYTGPGEIVRGGAPGTYLVKGKGGVLPTVTGISRSEPLTPDDHAGGYGFRLVLVP